MSKLVGQEEGVKWAGLGEKSDQLAEEGGGSAV